MANQVSAVLQQQSRRQPILSTRDRRLWILNWMICSTRCSSPQSDCEVQKRSRARKQKRNPWMPKKSLTKSWRTPKRWSRKIRTKKTKEQTQSSNSLRTSSHSPEGWIRFKKTTMIWETQREVISEWICKRVITWRRLFSKICRSKAQRRALLTWWRRLGCSGIRSLANLPITKRQGRQF